MLPLSRNETPPLASELTLHNMLPELAAHA